MVILGMWLLIGGYTLAYHGFCSWGGGSSGILGPCSGGSSSSTGSNQPTSGNVPGTNAKIGPQYVSPAPGIQIQTGGSPY